MGWAVGYDEFWERDIGYGVPAKCDHPGCDKDINRGLAYVCGGEPYGGEHGCGLYFCAEHLFYKLIDGRSYQLCDRCCSRNHKNDDQWPEPYPAKPDTQEWINWKMTDASWGDWRVENGYPRHPDANTLVANPSEVSLE